MKAKFTKEKTDLEKFIEERIKENKELFTQKELKVIKHNSVLIRKIYLLALLDSGFSYK